MDYKQLFYFIFYIKQFKISKHKMATQKQIDQLLNDEWDQQSRSKSKITQKNPTVIKAPKQNIYDQSGSYANEDFQVYESKQKSNTNFINIKKPQQKKYQQSYSYAHQEFQNYEQSRRSESMQQQSRQFAQNKQGVKSKQKPKELTSIKQQPQTLGKKQSKKQQPNKVTQNYMKPALQVDSKPPMNKKNNQTSYTQDKMHLAHNYARLQERQKQLMFTTITQQNKRLKMELQQQISNYKILENKYKVILSQKVEHTSTVKQLALQKQVTNLKTRLEQMSNLNKITEQREKYKAKLGKNPGNFIPEEEANKRQSQLLQLIQKLKRRLLQSDQNMGVLQKKLNQGVQYNDQLHRKMRRVEQLQYKIEKMTQQAQTDRGYIDILKQKVKQLQKQVENEKNKFKKQQIQMKRLQMSQLTHSDLVKELQQVRRQKKLLQDSLKQMSSAMMTNVRKNFQNYEIKIEDSNELIRTNIK